MGKRICSLILVLIMAFSLAAPVQASGTEEATSTVAESALEASTGGATETEYISAENTSETVILGGGTNVNSLQTCYTDTTDVESTENENIETTTLTTAGKTRSVLRSIAVQPKVLQDSSIIINKQEDTTETESKYSYYMHYIPGETTIQVFGPEEAFKKSTANNMATSLKDDKITTADS
jgi:hypothetical protein